MKSYSILLPIIILFFACTKRDNRKVVDVPEHASKTKKETTAFDIADLPIHIDSTSFMVHPIGNYSIKERRSEYLGSDSYDYEDYSNTSYSRDRISGHMSNIKFQHLDSNQLQSLTSKHLKISSMQFLRKVYKNIEKGYFLYNVTDKDTNADGKLGYNDLTSLYISNLDGTAFRKLSPNRQELDKWKIILKSNTLYFRSIEDIDSDGEFKKKDKMHYFYLNLDAEDAKVVEYFPI